MALSYTSIGYAPIIYYYPIKNTQARISNTLTEYTITFEAKFADDNKLGQLWYGYELMGYLLVADSNGNVLVRSSHVKIKDQDSDLWGPNEPGSTHILKTFSITVQVPSSAANEKHNFYLYVHKGSSRATDNTSVGSNPIGYLTSAALLYSKVTNPTTLITDVDTGIVTPESTIRLHWSGANKGTNNEIKGYQIGWNNKTSTDDIRDIIEVKASETSYNWTLLTNRGDYCYLFIKTLGEQAGYDAGWKRFDNYYRINSLPSAPTTSMKTRVPSTVNKINWDIVAGKDNVDTTQTMKIYSSVSEDVTTAIEWNKAADEFPVDEREYTRYFWTYDGLEFSESLKVQISRNKAPTISSLTDSGVTHKLDLTATGKDGDNDKLTYSFKITDNGTELKTQGPGENNKFFIDDIRSLLKATAYMNLTTIKTLTVTVTVTDGIDSTTQSIDKVIYPLPTIEDVFNQHGAENLANSTDANGITRFGQNFRIKFNSNNANVYNTINLSLFCNGDNNNILTKTFGNRSEYYWDVIWKGKLQYDEEYSFGIKFSSKLDPNLSWTKTDLFVIKRAADATPKGLKALDIKNILTTEQPIEYASIANYEYIDTLVLGSSPSLSYYWKISDNFTDKGSYVFNSEGAATININLSTETIWSLFKSLVSTNQYYSKYSGTFYVEVKNVFDETFSSSYPVTIDFREDTSCTLYPILTLSSEASGKTFDYDSGRHWLQEGVHLGTRFELKDYFGFNEAEDADEVFIEISRDEGASWSKLATLKPIKTDGELLIQNTPASFEYSINSFHVVGEINTNNENNRYFRLRTKNKAGVINYFNFRLNGEDSTASYAVRTHMPPQLIIDSASYNSDNKDIIAQVTCTAQSNASNLTYSYAGTININDKSENVELTENYPQLTIDYEIKDQYVKLNLQVSSHLTLNLNDETDTDKVSIVSTKTSAIVSTIVYNILPTLSYRTNHVGINTKDFETNDAFVVSAFDNKTIVKFKGVNADTGETITIDFDLTTGQISGANFDCGAWE